MMNYNEFQLIARISSLFPNLDVSDDAAFIPIDKGYLILTCDESAENIHFHRKWFSFEEIGYRAVASAVSDIASCGGKCNQILTAISIPDDLEESAILSIYSGIKELCIEFDIDLIGGNVTRSDSGLRIVTTAIGFSNYPVKRSGAQVGDIVCVTGDVGRSDFALKILLNSSRKPREIFLKKFRRPKPYLIAGELLNEHRLVHAMADISDGLVADLGHILKASGVGARINLKRVPCVDELRQYYKNEREMKIDACNSGEEYELIMTMPEENLLKAVDVTDIEIIPIGIITDDGFDVYIDGMNIEPQKLKGFEHF